MKYFYSTLYSVFSVIWNHNIVNCSSTTGPMTVKRQRGMVDQREISVTQNVLLRIKLNCTPRGWRFLTGMLKIKKYLGEKTFHYVKMNNCTVTSYKTQIERMRDPEHVTYSEKFRAWIKLKANNVSAAEEEQVEEGALRYAIKILKHQHKLVCYSTTRRR